MELSLDEKRELGSGNNGVPGTKSLQSHSEAKHKRNQNTQSGRMVNNTTDVLKSSAPHCRKKVHHISAYVIPNPTSKFILPKPAPILSNNLNTNSPTHRQNVNNYSPPNHHVGNQGNPPTKNNLHLHTMPTRKPPPTP